MNIEYSKAALKKLSAIDKTTCIRIKNRIEGIPRGDIKPLKGANGSFRLRVGDWRVVFTRINEDTITIDRIASRGDVYKEV